MFDSLQPHTVHGILQARILEWGPFPSPEYLPNPGILYQNLSLMQETWVRSLSWEDPLEKGTAPQLQCSGLENSIDRGEWWATVHEVAKSQT